MSPYIPPDELRYGGIWVNRRFHHALDSTSIDKVLLYGGFRRGVFVEISVANCVR